MAAASAVPEWQAVSDAFAVHLREHFAARGRDTTASATASTIRTNTELVPRRAANILAWLQALGGVETLRDQDVLEMGSGFGALAMYFAVSERPARIVAADISTDYIDVGRAVANELEVPNIDFVIADMRNLRAFADQTFDVIVLNNAFIYLTSAADADAALREFRRVLRPEGTIVFHHANKWQWREPFTRDPLIHLFPRPLATAASKLLGWKHNHGRVRLLSPRALRRNVQNAGFETVAVADPTGRRDGYGRYFGTYYVLVARPRP